MKWGTILLVALLTGAAFSQPSVTLLAPVPREFIPAGSPDTVHWSVNSPIQLDSASVYFSSDSGSNWTKLGEVPATQDTFIWTTPQLTSLKCLIRVEVKDTAGNSGSDVSENTFQVYIPGDANLNSIVNLEDVVIVIAWLFIRPVPVPPTQVLNYVADVNCTGTANLVDALVLAYHIFGRPGFETLCGRRGL